MWGGAGLGKKTRDSLPNMSGLRSLLAILTEMLNRKLDVWVWSAEETPKP